MRPRDRLIVQIRHLEQEERKKEVRQRIPVTPPTPPPKRKTRHAKREPSPSYSESYYSRSPTPRPVSRKAAPKVKETEHADKVSRKAAPEVKDQVEHAEPTVSRKAAPEVKDKVEHVEKPNEKESRAPQQPFMSPKFLAEMYWEWQKLQQASQEASSSNTLWQ